MTVTTEAAERLMKRCQIGVRYSQKNWEEAHDIMAACYGTIGALVQERDRLKGEAEVLRGLLREADAALALIEVDDSDEAERMRDLRTRIDAAAYPKQPNGGLF